MARSRQIRPKVTSGPVRSNRDQPRRENADWVETFECPNCGADVPQTSLSCPDCGSDADTGWSDEAGFELPEEQVEPNKGELIRARVTYVIGAVILVGYALIRMLRLFE